jgi:hypothetical protein
MLGAAVLAGCGGDERQDANEPDGDFPIEVVDASFPAKQKLGQTSDLMLRIRNAGNDAVPNLSVTVTGFAYRKDQPDLADASRPRFAVNGLPAQIGGFPEAKEAAPTSCQSAYVDTWACGPLRPDAERTLRWTVTAVVPGPYEIAYRVAAGLNGKARGVAPAGGSPPEGTLSGNVSSKPNRTRVGADGKTVVIEPR